MKTFQLTGQAREGLGKKATRELRKNGFVPAVLYGGEKEIHFQVSEKDIRNLIYTPDIYLVELNIGDEKHTAIIQATQFHPVEDKLLHIDFLEVSPDKPILMEVPVKLEGLAEGVKQGGKLTLEIRKLRVRAFYKNVPERLVIDVTPLGLGKAYQVGDLHFDNLEITNASNVVVCSVKLTRAAKGLQAKAE